MENINKELKVTKLTQDQFDKDSQFSAILAPLFIAWTKNKLTPIHFILQKPELVRSKEKIEAAVRTVYELCGHYCFDDDYEHCFFHLISLLEKWPNISKQECQRGVEDLKGILRLFHVQWNEQGESRR